MQALVLKRKNKLHLSNKMLKRKIAEMKINKKRKKKQNRKSSY